MIRVKKRERSGKKGSVDKQAERTHPDLEKPHELDLQHKEKEKNHRWTEGSTQPRGDRDRETYRRV